MIRKLLPDSTSECEEDETVEAVLLLHSICRSADEIAAKLHLKRGDVEHVIQHGTFPRKQLQLEFEEDGVSSWTP